ncbi:cysteine-rich receptor-like protein kinase 19 [Triticum dicoccoides]|uniref:cysteine-rich receptor-like protein kinase 19 n=1 Tax=Triticum dicoccoides TaxID=85692 RepID=UPI00188F7B68|nr:cysteine-rich receptor-like protein kinase 19 [Triticum dicoccoides]
MAAYADESAFRRSMASISSWESVSKMTLRLPSQTYMLLLQPEAANLLSFFSSTFAGTATLHSRPARYSLCKHSRYLKSLSCLMESANKGGFRLFRCLKCFDILRQPRNVSLYYSGGCNIAIRAKINVKGGPRNYLQLLILPYVTLSSLCISFISFLTKIISWTSRPSHRGADLPLSNGVSPQTKELDSMGVAANDSCTTLGAPSFESNGTGRNENENVMIAEKNVMVVSHTESNEDDNSDGRSTIGEMGDLNSATVAPRVLPFHLLENITNGFSEDRKLGAGSYGNVYMGEHEDGERIAVKVLHYTPGLDEQFEKEYLNHASLQHKNIVRLVGYSHETHCVYQPYNGKMVFAEMRKRALCFEYMTNGSLDKFLSDESSGHDWCTRYAIIKGICEGMQYLHEELGSPLYHLDLKPSNVLLDENMVPKIADFGLSRLGGEHTQMTKNAMGTP